MSSSPQPLFMITYVQHKRNYNFVSKENKKELIRLVRKGSTIKESAEELNIKYSAAKSIIKLDRIALMNSGIIHKSWHIKKGKKTMAKPKAKRGEKDLFLEQLPTSFQSSDTMFGLKNATTFQGSEISGINRSKKVDESDTSVKLPKFSKLPTFVYRDEEEFDKECIQQQLVTISK